MSWVLRIKQTNWAMARVGMEGGFCVELSLWRIWSVFDAQYIYDLRTVIYCDIFVHCIAPGFTVKMR